jgi:anaerobic magnesium-protoporphyrin IX monomethyl ester cyclase
MAEATKTPGQHPESIQNKPVPKHEGPRVLLLNPPSKRPVLRDYYCSTRPKAGYYWHPIDLLALGAQLGDRAVVSLLDAVAESLPPQAVIRRALAFRPQAIFALVATLTRDDDLAFLEQLSIATGAPVVIGGEVALDKDFNFAAYPFVRAQVLDFTDPGAVAVILGGPPSGRVRTATHAPTDKPARRTFSIGVSPHAQLLTGQYRLPLWPVSEGPFFSLLTDFGCPYTCSFCNSGRHAIGFALRDLDDIGQDVRAIAAHGGPRARVYLRDMTFGAVPEHSIAVLEKLGEYGLRSRGFTRADRITPTLARAMKTHGFEIAQIGVDLPDEAQRHAVGKHVTDNEQAEAFDLLKQHGVLAGAHFVIGFANDTLEAAQACVRMAEQLGAAYVSINLYGERLGTDALPRLSGLKRSGLFAATQAAMLAYNAKTNWRGLLAEAVPGLAPARPL